MTQLSRKFPYTRGFPHQFATEYLSPLLEAYADRKQIQPNIDSVLVDANWVNSSKLRTDRKTLTQARSATTPEHVADNRLEGMQIEEWISGWPHLEGERRLNPQRNCNCWWRRILAPVVVESGLRPHACSRRAEPSGAWIGPPRAFKRPRVGVTAGQWV